MAAAAGKVRIQASTMLPATPQRTADSFLVAPTPMMADVIVWVVEIGRPSRDVANNTALATASAAKPAGGSRWMTRRPRVRITRQPPEYVPRPSTDAEAQNTHSGMCVLLSW